MNKEFSIFKNVCCNVAGSLLVKVGVVKNEKGGEFVLKYED